MQLESCLPRINHDDKLNWAFSPLTCCPGDLWAANLLQRSPLTIFPLYLVLLLRPLAFILPKSAFRHFYSEISHLSSNSPGTWLHWEFFSSTITMQIQTPKPFDPVKRKRCGFSLLLSKGWRIVLWVVNSSNSLKCVYSNHTFKSLAMWISSPRWPEKLQKISSCKMTGSTLIFISGFCSPEFTFQILASNSPFNSWISEFCFYFRRSVV